jgi:CsoR family transcriptional regulator, copper-sensing transcriptional repressor
MSWREEHSAGSLCAVLGDVEVRDAGIEHCVRDAIDQGGPEADAKIAEASAAIARLVKP